jgi:hypothetical protein
MGKGLRGAKAARVPAHSWCCASDGSKSSLHNPRRTRIFVFGFRLPSMWCGGMAACVGVGGVGTDIRHPLERDRRALTPLSRTPKLGSCDALAMEACDYGAFDGDSIVIHPLRHIPRRNSLYHRGSLIVYIFRKGSKTQRHENVPDDGCRAHMLFISLAGRALSTHVIATSKPPRSSAD